MAAASIWLLGEGVRLQVCQLREKDQVLNGADLLKVLQGVRATQQECGEKAVHLVMFKSAKLFSGGLEKVVEII